MAEFKPGDRVLVYRKHPAEFIKFTRCDIRFEDGTERSEWVKELELIPPTTEELVAKLERAGFVQESSTDSDYKLFSLRVGDTGVLVSTFRGYRVVISAYCGDVTRGSDNPIICTSFPAAVKLALATVEATKEEG